MKSGISSILDEAVGSGLGNHIRAGYSFLMQNYAEGDKICLFGFSRGAYTARSLAGMLHKVGLLPRDNEQQIAFAYATYKREDDEGWKLSGDFKRTFCIDVLIEFLGVWDTVASVGFIPRAALPFSSSSNPSVRHFRQALALDEHRAKFKANHWIDALNDISTSASVMEQRTTAAKEGHSAKLVEVFGAPAMAKNRRKDVSSGVRMDLEGTRSAEELKKDVKEAAEEVAFSKRQGGREWETTVEEVWFTGAHCDVGGGAVPNQTRHQLARIPLRWMIRACFRADTEMIFSSSVLASLGFRTHTLYPRVLPRDVPITTSLAPSILDAAKAGELPQAGTVNPFMTEETEDYFDSLQPINDMLKKKGWWALEVLVPLKSPTKDAGGIWITKTRPNLGRHRVVRDERPTVHYSVLLRQAELGYKMSNEVDVDAHWHVTM